MDLDPVHSEYCVAGMRHWLRMMRLIIYLSFGFSIAVLGPLFKTQFARLIRISWGKVSWDVRVAGQARSGPVGSGWAELHADY